MKICFRAIPWRIIAENLFAMQAQRSSGKEKVVKEKTESADSDFEILLEQMKLKNEALKKIYEFFGKEKKELPDKKDNTR